MPAEHLGREPHHLARVAEFVQPVAQGEEEGLARLVLAQTLLDALAFSDLERRADEADGLAVLEGRPPPACYPTLHAIVDPDHAVIDMVDSVAGWIPALCDGGLDARAI